MRMMRDSPAELARAFPGPYESTSKTRLSRRAKCHAVHAPNTPAPTMTTSNRSIALNPLKSYLIRRNAAPFVTRRGVAVGNSQSILIQLYFMSHHDAVKLRLANSNQAHQNLRRPHASPFFHRHNS